MNNGNKKGGMITPETHTELRKTGEFYKGSLRVDADVVVIGSGAGGAVSASEFARAGFSVVLLEEGPSLQPEEFSPDEFKSFSRIYQDAAYVSSEDYSIHVLAGRVIGGSTTVNWQTCIYPDQQVTTGWEKGYGLKGYSRKEMAPWIGEVERRVGVVTVPRSMINQNNRLMADGASKLSIEYLNSRNNNGGRCIGLGRCGLGCPIGAKQGANVTFVPDAIKHGALVYSSVRVEKIIDGEMKTVVARYSPDPGKDTPDGAIEKFRFSAPLVVVSGGALGSPGILQRSGLGNDFVGRRVKLHPTASVLAKFPQLVDSWHGTPQSVMVDQFRDFDGKGFGFLLEVAPYRPTTATLLFPSYGEKMFRLMKDYRYLQSGLVITRDGASGALDARLEYSGGMRKLHFTLSEADSRNVLHGIRQIAMIQKAAGAQEIVFPFARMEDPFVVTENETFDWVLNEKTNPGELMLGSAHPHGSVQAAASPKEGAIDPDFQLYGHKNIYVIDGSWPPTAIGVNPQILVMSSAMKAARKIIKKGNG